MGPSSNFTLRLCLLVALIASWAFAATPAVAQDVREEIAADAAASTVDATRRLDRRPPRAAPWDITLEGGLSFFDDPDGILGVTPPAGTPGEQPVAGGDLDAGQGVAANQRVEGTALQILNCVGALSFDTADIFQAGGDPAGFFNNNAGFTLTFGTITVDVSP